MKYTFFTWKKRLKNVEKKKKKKQFRFIYITQNLTDYSRSTRISWSKEVNKTQRTRYCVRFSTLFEVLMTIVGQFGVSSIDQIFVAVFLYKNLTELFFSKLLTFNFIKQRKKKKSIIRTVRKDRKDIIIIIQIQI